MLYIFLIVIKLINTFMILYFFLNRVLVIHLHSCDTRLKTK